MGFLDGFTSDGTVEMKHTEYYNLMREAAKAELIGNAVKAEVPGFYIQAMITGKTPEIFNVLEAEEENTGFGAEYEQITGAAVSIFEAWMKENGVKSAAASLHRLIDTLEKNRLDELKTMEENREEYNAHMKEAFREAMKNMEKMPVISITADFGNGKDSQGAAEEGSRECWSCRTCGNCKPLSMDLDVCKACDDGSNYTKADNEKEEAHRMEEEPGQQEQESEKTSNGND